MQKSYHTASKMTHCWAPREGLSNLQAFQRLQVSTWGVVLFSLTAFHSVDGGANRGPSDPSRPGVSVGGRRAIQKLTSVTQKGHGCSQSHQCPDFCYQELLLTQSIGSYQLQLKPAGHITAAGKNREVC